MKIRIIQKDIGDIDCFRYVEAAAEDQVDLVCLGELATSGVLYRPTTAPEVDDLVKRVAGAGPAVAFGAPVEIDGHLRNSYFWVDQAGVQRYDKINLFAPMGETGVYRPGNQLGLFDTAFGMIGVAICYDIRFPDIFEQFTRQQVRMVLVPAAFPAVRVHEYRQLLIERAQDHGYWVVGINAVGDDGENLFGGNSMVVDPAGRVVAEADRESATVIDAVVALKKPQMRTDMKNNGRD